MSKHKIPPADMIFLEELYDVIVNRADADPKESYTAKLFAKGREKIAQKVGEEGVEVVIEAVADNKKKAVSESADLLFHLMILWADMGIHPGDVVGEMKDRHIHMKKKG